MKVARNLARSLAVVGLLLFGLFLGLKAVRVQADDGKDDRLPTLFRVGAQVTGVQDGKDVELRVLEVQGRWIRASAGADGAELWICPERWNLWWRGGTATAKFASTRAAVELQEKNFAVAIIMYYLDKRQLPNSLKDLTVASEKDNEAFIDTIPLDPWGTDYDYQIVNRQKREYEIRSAGEDKIYGTADDIVYRSADSGR